MRDSEEIISQVFFFSPSGDPSEVAAQTQTSPDTVILAVAPQAWKSPLTEPRLSCTVGQKTQERKKNPVNELHLVPWDPNKGQHVALQPRMGLNLMLSQ